MFWQEAVVNQAEEPGKSREAGSPLDIPRNPDGEFKVLRGERYFQKVWDLPVGHAYVELIDYADNNRCDTVSYR